MGGTSSLLEETDWEKADGKIDNPLDTVDGAPPTEQFALFYIVKKGFNQREFDVTDSDNNLLYTTRQVPATVCSFDVLGNDIGSYKLRVHSDLARRYWIVYRFGSQSFEMQQPNKEESEKAEQQFADIELRVERPIQLYKRLCVTVSWSRYLAVAAFFGPPTLEMLMEYSKQDKEDYTENDDDEALSKLEGDSSHGTRRDFQSALDGDADKVAPNPENDQHLVDQDITTESISMKQTSSRGIHISTASSKHEDAAEQMAQNPTHRVFAKSVATPSMNVQHWLQKHSKSFRETSRKVLHSTLDSKQPMEGALDLEKPLILCQEIYTRLIGNHQTSRVSRERVLSLLQQDTAQHVKSNTSKGEACTSDPMIMTNGHLIRPEDDSSPGEGVEESKSDADVNGHVIDQTEEAVVSIKEEPLVAYWKWEHSFQAQKMKLHLAKNSDLALHIVLAIIVNQVRYERNAIAMTI